MNIAIFENEIQMLEGAFNAMNLLYFDNDIEFTYFTNSQDAKPYENLKKYNIVFVDIQLTDRSELDGFNLIKELMPIIGKEKIAIVTGFSKNEQVLDDIGLPSVPILIKPVDYKALYNFIRENFQAFSKP